MQANDVCFIAFLHYHNNSQNKEIIFDTTILLVLDILHFEVYHIACNYS